MTFRVEHLADGVTVYLGDCLEVMPTIGKVGHVIGDPPYEAITHDAKSGIRKLRQDAGPELRGIDFAPIDAIRRPFVEAAARACDGWVIVFCTPEGVAKWADTINPSPIRYKRACVWVKPDAAPQMNGQGPAQGAENFVCSWAGKGYSRWNAGGKRGVYTHLVNPPNRDGRHPTEKPLALMSEILTDFTNPGDLICDPFMGGGTTGVAAVKLGRRFIGIEKNQKWFDVACDRISRALREPSMFVAMPKPAKQESLFAGDA